jgi:hypothetical protein
VARGVRRVSGDLLLVNGLFVLPRVHPDWPRDQLTTWYEAPVDGLSFNDNCVLVRVTPGAKPGAPARVQTVPSLAYFKIRNTARTTSDRKQSRLFVGRLGDSDEILVSGGIWSRSGPSEEWVAVVDPVAYFGAALRAALESRDPRGTGGARLPPAGWEASPRTRATSRPPSRSPKRTDFYAEIWSRRSVCVSRERRWARGVQKVGEFLLGLGLPLGSFELADGSGLARGNRMTPRAMTTLLDRMFRHKHSREFVLSLPWSGEPGLSWKRRLAAAPYRGNVFAKTGTISGVSTLSGYAKAKSGKVYAFSILCNQIRGLGEAHRARTPWCAPSSTLAERCSASRLLSVLVRDERPLADYRHMKKVSRYTTIERSDDRDHHPGRAIIGKFRDEPALRRSPLPPLGRWLPAARHLRRRPGGGGGYPRPRRLPADRSDADRGRCLHGRRRPARRSRGRERARGGTLRGDRGG